MSTEPIVVQENRVVLRGELAEDVIHNVSWSETPNLEAFKELFEIVGEFPGDPSESYYQGRTITQVIRRKSDGRLFGFSFWQGGGEYGESFVEPNGEEHGIEPERNPPEYEAEGGEVYVFLPAKEFSVKGYAVEDT